MAALEERVAYLEGKVEEHARGMDGMRDAIVQLGQRLVHLEERMDRRFEAIDRRFEGVERRLDGLDDKLSRHFVWLVGVQVTTLAAIIAALVAR